jgi:hypothetical protein
MVAAGMAVDGCDPWDVERRSGRTPGTGWAAMRPVFVAFLLAGDAFVVAVLAIARPSGWGAPFAAFGSILLGLICFEVWAVRHRHDDD